MLYLKLIIRGVLRHKKRGRRLFALIVLCVAAIIFCFAFKDSFRKQYIEQGIDIWTGHINVVSPQSSIMRSDTMIGADDQDLPLITIDKDFEEYVSNLEHVKIASPILETYMLVFNLEGDLLEIPNSEDGHGDHAGGMLSGMRSEDMIELFPQKFVLEGESDFSYNKSMTDIPVLRQKLTKSEIIPNNDIFVRNNFRYNGEDFEHFKNTVRKEFPTLFESSNFIQGASGTNTFIDALNMSLKNPDLISLIPESYFQTYNWQLDDIISEIEALKREKDNMEERDLKILNKKLFKTLYPEVITPVLNEITLDKPLTALTFPARTTNASDEFIIMPIKFVGFVTAMPIFQHKSCIMDVSVLQSYLELSPDEYTKYVIRVESKEYVPVVKQKIEEYVAMRGLDYEVIDYNFSGKLYMPSAEAFNIIFTVLIILFIIISIIFTVNLVILSIIKRRKEIGMNITIGLGKTENILLFLGEIAFILTLAWAIGAVIGGALIVLCSRIGIPKMFFFVNGMLFFHFDIKHLIFTYLLLLPPAMIAALIPCLSIYKLDPVAILQEAN